MRIHHLLAAMLVIAGVGAAAPANAETSLARSTATPASLAQPAASGAAADQYRSRRGNRGYRGGYGYRGNRGYRGYRRGYYRPRYNAYRPYRWRGRTVCRTSWRWGRPHRICYRRW